MTDRLLHLHHLMAGFNVLLLPTQLLTILEQAMNVNSRTDVFDVIIVGGGPAGLTAALMLGRACKRVLVCDAGKPRN
ncbi:FAD-binding protein [Leptolyngbya sp. FACHB-321]|uniref:FAD-binding protein n=1 Tax=Leptolyngbya sp. FACHB-321 TaxID=2692807 RepID=UPI001A7E1FBE|nr:FAD-binding protein [Leptolyngbya sp. FACHB-321]